MIFDQHRHPTLLLSSGNNNVNNQDDIFANETPEEREERMKLVRQIQGTFYQQSNEEVDDAEATLVAPSSNGILQNVPLFRVQWTELPGYQNILNIHVPHYTHMFRKIMAGPKPWRFGHIYLPGGSENLSNPDYALEEGTGATMMGTLMQIADAFEQEDGRLAIIVQGVEKIRVVTSIQSEPFAMADVQLVPDDEVAKQLRASKSKTSPFAKCATDLDEWNQWEILPTTWDNPKDNGLRAISPLSNYNSQYFPDEVGFGTSAESSFTQHDEAIEEMEQRMWIALDEMIRLMQEAVSGNVPIPSQLLGLLPTQVEVDWPEGFQLDSYASQLEAKNAEIGTYTKTPFVRVSLCESYPSIRRANRLSYVVWILLSTLLSNVGATGYPTPQELLELDSTRERLELASTHLESINTVLRRA
ncbi:MAG: hypothetical protein SGBAC_009528 [Bacillariaceae sp.]